MQTHFTAKAAKRFAKAPALQRNRLKALVTELETAPFLGDQLHKARIPSSLRGAENLWRAPLPEGWRILYTVIGLGQDVTPVVILWIGTHTEYNRLLGYK